MAACGRRPGHLGRLSEKGEWMKRSKWFFLAAMLSVFALIGAACGGDDDPSDAAG